jgi:hypothetical protein
MMSHRKGGKALGMINDALKLASMLLKRRSLIKH